MNETILVLGSTGQLGQELRKLAADDPKFVFADRSHFDALDLASVNGLIKLVKPTTVINAVAYVKFDQAEEEAELCKAINVDFVANLAEESRRKHFHFVHFSSDYVFGGDKNTPYTENDSALPLSVYGRSKVDGENAVLELANSAAVVRTSWLYSSSGHNFLKTMLRLANDEKPVRVVNDQTGCPTWTSDLAFATINAFAKRTDVADLFHFSGNGHSTWCEFANEIFELWGIGTRAEPIATTAFPSAGVRPTYSVLSVSKFEKTFGCSVPDWRESLARCHSKWDI